MDDVYIEQGYLNRENYLNDLAEDTGVPLHEVEAIAELLGPEEDFDGLVVMVQDRAEELK